MSNIFKQTLTDGESMIRFHVVSPLSGSQYEPMATITITTINGGALSRKVPVSQARDTYRLYTKGYGFTRTDKPFA